MAGTDCGDCGYPDCFGYSNAISLGKDWAPDKCAPGGADSKSMLETIIVTLKTGQLPAQPAAPAPEGKAAGGAPAASPEPAETIPLGTKPPAA
jgi:Na+-translocating ferredoxin:NAD+ oxidoreductase RNF subunit RnfB